MMLLALVICSCRGFSFINLLATYWIIGHFDSPPFNNSSNLFTGKV
jgi:hypothetical protein